MFLHTEVCLRPDGRVVEISSRGGEPGILFRERGQERIIPTFQGVLFPRAAASDDRVLVVYKGQQDTAFIVNDLGQELPIALSCGNHCCAIERRVDGTFSVAVTIEGCQRYVQLIVTEDCRELARAEGAIPRAPGDSGSGSSQGFRDILGGQLAWMHLERLVKLGPEWLHAWMNRGDWTVGLRGEPDQVLVYRHSTGSLFTLRRPDRDALAESNVPPRIAATPRGFLVAVSGDPGLFLDERHLEPFVDEPEQPEPTPPPPTEPTPPPAPPPPIEIPPAPPAPPKEPDMKLEGQQLADFLDFVAGQCAAHYRIPFAEARQACERASAELHYAAEKGGDVDPYDLDLYRLACATCPAAGMLSTGILTQSQGESLVAIGRVLQRRRAG